MAKKKAALADIRALSDDELVDRIDGAKEELFNLRFQLASGQLDDYTRVRIVRREVARLKTVLRERQLAAQLLQEEGNA